MQTIDQAFQEVCRLHEQLAHAPAPEIGPQAFLPFPPGVNPMAYAIEEVAQLKRLCEGAQAGFDPTQQQSQQQQQQHPQVTWVPRANIHASETNLLFHVELPGVSKEDVSVTVSQGELIVRGQRRAATHDASLKPMFVEQPYGSFERRFPCPPWCDPEKIQAKYSHGVLEIQLTRLDEGNRGEFRVNIG